MGNRIYFRQIHFQIASLRNETRKFVLGIIGNIALTVRMRLIPEVGHITEKEQDTEEMKKVLDLDAEKNRILYNETYIAKEE